MFGVRQNGIRLLILCPELVDGFTHRHRGLATGILRRMAISADGLVSNTKQRVARCEDLMITVTGGAPRNSHLNKDLPMTTLAKQLGIDGVALAADIPHPR